MSLAIDTSQVSSPDTTASSGQVTFAGVQTLAADQITALLPSSTPAAVYTPSQLYNAVSYQAFGAMGGSGSIAYQDYLQATEAASASTTATDSTSTADPTSDPTAADGTASDTTSDITSNTTSDPATDTTSDPTAEATSSTAVSDSSTSTNSSGVDSSANPANMTDELLQEAGWTAPAANPYQVTTDFFADQTQIPAANAYGSTTTQDLGQVYNALV